MSFKTLVKSVSNMLKITSVIIPCFGPLNSSKNELKIVKKNPSSTEIKNCANLNILLEKICILFLFYVLFYYFDYMLSDFERVQVLSEALPFIQKFSGRTVVIKYGGSAMQNQELKSEVVQDILFLSCIGLNPVLVHGGGPFINKWLGKLGIKAQFHKGMRVTDSSTMEVVEMVLVGKLNQELVALINRKKGRAVGLSGKDAGLITATSLFDQADNFVGRVNCVNTDIINLLVQKGYIPVIASVAAGLDGSSYNINADTVAGAIAAALKAEKLILLTDTPGIMRSINDPQSLIKFVDILKVDDLKNKKIISGGMIPKVDCCIDAIRQGVKSAHIIDGRIRHALLLEVLTKDGIGSMIT